MRKYFFALLALAALPAAAVTTTLEYEDLREVETRAAVSNELASAVAPLASTNDLAAVKSNLETQIANATPADYASVSNRAMSAVQTETDPTVPAWAKSETPPVTVEQDPVFTNWVERPYVELGLNSAANRDHHSVAIGTVSLADAGNSVAIGRSAQIESINEDKSPVYTPDTIEAFKSWMWTANTAIGYAATVTTDWQDPEVTLPTQLSTAIGSQASVTKSNSVAVGPLASVVARDSVAIGYNAVASNESAVAIGPWTVTHGDNTVNLHATQISKIYLGTNTLQNLVRDYVNLAIASNSIPEAVSVSETTGATPRRILLAAAAPGSSTKTEVTAADVGALTTETDPSFTIFTNQGGTISGTLRVPNAEFGPGYTHFMGSRPAFFSGGVYNFAFVSEVTAATNELWQSSVAAFMPQTFTESDPAAAGIASNVVTQAYIQERLGVYLYLGQDGGIYVHTPNP